MSEQMITTPAADTTLQQLRSLSHGLLRLHKVLLERERDLYERVHGQVSSGDMLQLLINHEEFAWLRHVSGMIVLIDELLDAEKPVAADDAESLLERTRTLLTPSETGDEFERRYYAALQEEPTVVLAHAEVRRILNAQ